MLTFHLSLFMCRPHTRTQTPEESSWELIKLASKLDGYDRLKAVKLEAGNVFLL